MKSSEKKIITKFIDIILKHPKLLTTEEELDKALED